MQIQDRLELTPSRSRRSLLSLTPLIDVVFILLVFFMLASSFSTERVIDLLMPAETESTPGGKPGAVLVRIQPGGGIDLNGEAVARGELVQRIAAWSTAEQARRYLVQPADGVTTQQIVSVIDLMKSSGARSVSLTRR